MQKVVIDTNVVVSALIQRNYPFLILDELFFENKIEMCVSEALLKEYYEVLRRPKFAKFPDFSVNAESILTEIGLKAKFYNPKIKIDLITDKDDNMILELADECSADFVITGNTKDFVFPSYKNTKIVTPKEYWENHKPS